MADQIMRVLGVFLLAGSAAAFIFFLRNRLSILQSAIMVGLITTAGLFGMILLLIPEVITRPILLMMMALSSPTAFGATWYSYRARLRQVHQFRHQAQEARDRGDVETAQRFQAMADLLVQISGRIKEFKDTPVSPPS